ncbi:MAG: LysR family transcriptional regulator [Planctomycetota bacterium]
MSEAPLDPTLLATFLDVLHHGGIGAAARATDLSQPAITARIGRLERSLGTTLLTRSPKGVAPTPAGDRLAGYARRVQELLDEASVEVPASDANLGRLSLVASTTIAAYALPPALAAFRTRYPLVPLDVTVANTRDAIEAVRDGRVPIGLVEGHARASGVRLEPWIDDHIVPVVATGAPWRLRSVEELDDLPILWREAGSGTRAVVARALGRAGVRRRPRGRDLVLASSEAIAGACAAGLGVAFLSRWTLGPQVAAGRLRPVAALELEIRRTFRWALPSGALGGTAGLFLKLARGLPLTPA